MEKEEVLKKSKRKSLVGEMEREKINKSSWISLIVAAIVAVTFIIVEGALGHHAAQFAIAAICFIWASVFYTLQFFLAKRPYGVLVGAVLEGLAGIAMIVLYIISNVQGW